jgi:hypothetical protein
MPVTVLGVLLDPGMCWLTEVSYRAHRAPKIALAEGEHDLTISAFYRLEKVDASFKLVVPPFGAGRVTLRPRQ